MNPLLMKIIITHLNQSVFSVAIFKAENGRLGKAQHVWFSVTNGRVSFCDPDGKPIVVTESLLQNYPFDQYKDRV